MIYLLCIHIFVYYYECIPVYIGRYWDMVDRLQVNQFFTVPSAIRLLMKVGDKLVTKYNLSSLKTIASSEYTYTLIECSLLIPCKMEHYKLMHRFFSDDYIYPPTIQKQELIGKACLPPLKLAEPSYILKVYFILYM